MILVKNGEVVQYDEKKIVIESTYGNIPLLTEDIRMPSHRYGNTTLKILHADETVYDGVEFAGIVSEKCYEERLKRDKSLLLKKLLNVNSLRTD